MSRFYTSVAVVKNDVYVMGYDNGRRVNKKVKYKPYLFLASPEETGYKTIYGQNVSKMEFESIYEAKDFKKNYKDVEDFKIYGMDKFVYTYIYDQYISKKFEYDVSQISTAFIDIETSLAPASRYVPDHIVKIRPKS